MWVISGYMELYTVIWGLYRIIWDFLGYMGDNIG